MLGLTQIVPWIAKTSVQALGSHGNLHNLPHRLRYFAAIVPEFQIRDSLLSGCGVNQPERSQSAGEICYDSPDFFFPPPLSTVQMWFDISAKTETHFVP